jgi:alpha-tubulin suppressor-like RCC1 family protein
MHRVIRAGFALLTGAILALSTSPVANGKTPVSGLIAASDHTCVITAEHRVACWGDGRTGGLGDGTTTSSTTPVDVVDLPGDVFAIAAGDRFSCALTAGGAVDCWGNNEFGQLGDGTRRTRLTPIAVVGLDRGVTAIAARGEHACALRHSRVLCWGGNIDGQLGDGTTIDRTGPVEVSGLDRVSSIATGGEHTCAILTQGGAMCWGWNVEGQLGDGLTADAHRPVAVEGLTGGVSAISAGGRHTCALMTQGGVKCWGYGEFGQLGDGSTARSSVPVDVSGLSAGIASITAGGNLTCGLRTAGGVTCWGIDPTGASDFASVPTDIPAIPRDVLAVKAGFYHICVVKAGGTVACWGGNDAGQLGNGTTSDTSAPTDVIHADGTRLVVMVDESPVGAWLPAVVVAIVGAVGLLAVVGWAVRRRQRGDL